MATGAQQASDYFNQVLGGDSTAVPQGYVPLPIQGAVPNAAQSLAEQAAGGFHPLQYAKSYAEIPGNFLRFLNPATEFGASDFAASLPAGAAGIAGTLAAGPVGNAVTSATGDPNEGYAAKALLRDAAIGGSVGSFLPGLGTAAGALGGTVVGGIQSLLHAQHSGGNPDAKTVQQLQGVRDQTFDNLSNMGVDPNTINTIHQEYDKLLNDPTQLTLQPGDTNPLTGKTVGSGGQQLSVIDSQRARAFSYLSQAQQAWQQNSSTTLPGLPDNSSTSVGLSPQQMLSLQDTTTRLMSPLYDSLRKEGQSEIQAWTQASTPAGQHVSAAVKNLAGMYSGSLGELTDAYKLQAQAQPFLNAVASNLYNKGIQAQNAPTSSGSGTLASLLAGSQAAGNQSSSTQLPLTATNYGASPLLIQ